MKATSQRVCLAVLAMMIASLMAACGSGGGSGAATSAPVAGGSGAPTTTAAGGNAGAASSGTCSDVGKGQQITMWSPLTGPDGDEMTALANQFSQENSLGIKVTHTAQPDYLQKLNTAAAGNSLPDMTVICAGDIGEMAVRNVLKPMSTDALAEAGGADMLKGQFTEAVWNAGQVKDQRYTIPSIRIHWCSTTTKICSRRPASPCQPIALMTKDEFEKAVDALNKDGIAGVSIGTAFQTGAWFQALIREFGGDITDANGTKATYNSDQGVQAATYIHDLKARTSPQVNGAGDPEVKLFQQQKAAMVFHGPWHISDMVKLPFVGFAQMPQIGGTYSVWGNSHQLADDDGGCAQAGCRRLLDRLAFAELGPVGQGRPGAGAPVGPR